MKIEKIELNKIKVTVCVEDLQLFNLNANRIKPDSPELNIFLCELMKKVQNETNFDPYNGQVVVEATPDGDGLVLMVSKVEEKEFAKVKERKKIKSVKAVKKAAQKYICRFDNFDDICEFFKSFSKLSLENSELYKLNENYCLIYDTKNADRRISEFCKVEAGGAFSEAYLREHGDLVAKGEKLFNIIDFVKNSY